MPVIPALKALLGSIPKQASLKEMSLEGQRQAGNDGATALAAAVAEEPREVGTITEALVEVDGGHITVRIYQPKHSGPHPIHLYYHGGGWMFGTIDDPFVDIVCRERTALAGFVSVAVEYRLAPEHKFPGPLNDSYAALEWIVEHAAEFDADPTRVTVGGGSAGANLAAAITLKARNENGPAITFQLLEVPALDLTASSPSVEKYGTGEYPLSRAELQVCLDGYLPAPEDATNEYASPLLAQDLSGLPPAHIMTSEFDPLQDDGARYAEKLNAAGSKATLTMGAGHVHGSSQFTKLLPEAAAWRDEAIAQLIEHADRHAVTGA
ncbi:Carboxylesterase NlhH [Arthrobacter sp. 9V]|uniref:alpha/beta hydrolase n=1 Tax=Arthrobacter sp. 9V TaxID=2653132 RepID=UPI0012F2489C|nr:alpha/beta hydrolase [Arthrobacter sp. 9V]VXB52428.1 Carboxylesterase NlhH [Arthrobacter sp. 9V]